MMAYQIDFKGSDKHIVSEHNESILASAIRAGVQVNYGCNNGNCGLCVTRLISGDIKQISHHDYHLDPTERQQGKFPMCAYTANDDLVIESEILNTNTYIEPQIFSAKTRSIKAVSDRVSILTLQPPRSYRLRFWAGQYSRIRIKDISGEYAIASCPCDGRRLEFHIAYMPDDDFSNYIFTRCTKGDVFTIEAPFGNFVFNDNLSQPIIFLAFGVGFAPIKSLLEHITAQESEVPVYLYRVVADGDHYLDNLCCSWEDALDQLHYRHFTADIYNADETTTCVTRLLDEHNDLPQASFYCCAPAEVLPAVYKAAQNRPEGWHFLCEKIHDSFPEMQSGLDT